MPTVAKSSSARPKLHPDFVEKMVRTSSDSDEHGVHLLFNEWWPHAADINIERYLENFRATLARAASCSYPSSPLDELSLQAFCLAQLQFPYFVRWIATTTSRMTFLQPDGIVPVVDAITQGWRYGRAAVETELGAMSP